MLLGVVADLHANLEAALAVFNELAEARPDRVICLGDVAGYNANPNEVIDFMRHHQIPTLMGNHDAAACGKEESWHFNSRAQAAIAWQMDQLREDNKRWLANLPPHVVSSGFVLGVHGSPKGRDDYIVDWVDAMRQIDVLDEKTGEVCLFGHSHLASFFGERDGVTTVTASSRHTLDPQGRYLINPGAVGQPRDRDPRAAFGLLDTEKREFQFRRVEYDVETAAQKVVEAGLPPTLAERLREGR